MRTKFTDQLATDESVLFEYNRVNARIPKGKNGHRNMPGTLYVTNKRIVHDYNGLFGMGASRHQIPIRLVATVATGFGLMPHVEITALDGKTTRFRMSTRQVREVAELIQNQQTERQL